MREYDNLLEEVLSTPFIKLDIDIDGSFMLEDVIYVNMGMNGGMMMNMSGFTFMPTMRLVDMSTSGTIHGIVRDAVENLPNATISLMHNGTLYTTTHSDGNGNYAFIGIPQGLYTIKVEIEDWNKVVFDLVESIGYKEI